MHVIWLGISEAFGSVSHGYHSISPNAFKSWMLTDACPRLALLSVGLSRVEPSDPLCFCCISNIYFRLLMKLKHIPFDDDNKTLCYFRITSRSEYDAQTLVSPAFLHVLTFQWRLSLVLPVKYKPHSKKNRKTTLTYTHDLFGPVYLPQQQRP